MNNQWGETGTFTCNPGKARLVVLSGERSGQVFPISSICLIGRGEHATVDLDLLEVSRSHARIHFDHGKGWTLEDLNSANGTWLDGVPVKGRVPLNDGSRLQLGGSMLLVFTHRDVLEDQIFQQQKLEVLGRLAGEVAHDLRNLLTVYRYNIDYVREAVEEGQLVPAPGLDVDELNESLQELDNVTKRATDLTGRLLGFARMEGEDREEVDLGALVKEVGSMADTAVPDSIQVEVRVEPRRLPVSASSGRIHQALMNLCINARDAMPHGGKIQISASMLQVCPSGLIDLPVVGQGDFVVVSIQDDGQGMDEEIQGKIFEPFYTTKQQQEGTGLGLATVWAVVKDHGGQVSVRSAPGKGTTFTLAFPAATSKTCFKATQQISKYETEQYAAAVVTQKEDRNTTEVGMPSSVLVISSRRTGRQNMAQCLKELALNVLWEETAGEALGRLQGDKERIAAIVLDTHLEGVQPEQLGKTLRRIAPDVPLVFWSDLKEPDALLERQAAAGSAHAVLLTPITTKALHQAISYAVSIMISNG